MILKSNISYYKTKDELPDSFLLSVYHAIVTVGKSPGYLKDYTYSFFEWRNSGIQLSTRSQNLFFFSNKMYKD